MILVFGKTPELMARALYALSHAGMKAEGALSLAEAVARLDAGGVAVVAVGGGVPADERRQVHLAATAAGATVVDVHGPQTLISTVRAALAG